MQEINKPTAKYVYIDRITGLAWTDGMAGTKDYAVRLTERTLGKRRMTGGDTRLAWVTVTPMTDEEAAAHEQEYAQWLAKRRGLAEPPK